METTIKDVIKSLRRTDDQYHIEVSSLKESIDWDLDFLRLAIIENNQEDIRKYKNNINETRRKLMELEYYPFKLNKQ